MTTVPQPLPLRKKDWGTVDIHAKVIDRRITFLGCQQWWQLHIWFVTRFYYNNETDIQLNVTTILQYNKIRQRSITKYMRFFITKCESFIANATAIKRYDVYYKTRRYRYVSAVTKVPGFGAQHYKETFYGPE